VSRPDADPNAYLQAVEWFRQRVPLEEGEFLRVVQGAHEKAFTVAGVAQLDLVTQVWEAVDDALAKGTTLAEFRMTIEDRLTAAWGKSQPYRVETILRTNVQHAYSRGRWEQQNDPDVKAMRPFLEFSAVMDGRTSEICRPIDGTILSADDPFWKTHVPPLHHSCRSTTISLTEAQAKTRGVTPTPPTATPAEGFGAAPGENDWHPDLRKYPAELGAVAAGRLAMR
jgi:SPP1 gp7 family putative phage head morphogenesis protein